MSCYSCHGDDLSGGAGPQLDNIGSKLIQQIIVNGTGAMPGRIVDDETASEIAEWLSDME